MYRVIVVDDEQIIRNGIKSFIDYEIEYFDVLHCFCDGLEAIEYLKKNDVDLVISDIKMTHVSGIELARYIFENNPMTKVILLSGYREFDYAISAIQYGVTNYILKPANFEEFKKTLLQVKKELDKCNISKAPELFMDKTKLLYSQIVSNQRQNAKDILQSAFEDIKDCQIDYVSQYIYDLFEVIFDKINLDLKISLCVEKFDLKKFLSLEDIEEIKDWAIDILDKIFNLVISQEDASKDFIFQGVIDYIHNNIHEEISLQDMADKMFFSTVYFSRYFKKQTGETFSNYLLKVRMEHAIELLQKNKKVIEISDACGYRDPSYFSRIFKEYYKYTPTDYARRFTS